MAEDDEDFIPDSGAVFTFGRSRFADNIANKFWIKNDPVTQVACGDEHSAILTERGRVYVFGSNEWGQLGLGHVKNLTKPSFIKALKPEKIILIACGRSHTLVYAESHKLFSFGTNGDGQLGLGNKQDELSPKEVLTLSSIALKNISCGAYHSAVLTEKGEVYVWGVNSDGQLGLGDVEESLTPVKLNIGHSVRSLSCGYYHTALVANDGLVFTFGEDENGKLGLSDSQLGDTTIPQSVVELIDDKYIDVSCGSRHTVAITKKGLTYSWGDGSHGQLGHGTMLLESAVPKQIESLNGMKIISVSCGDSHTSVLRDDGKLFTFGDGRHGKLGQGDECFSNLFSPTIISRFIGFRVNYVACGGCHMLVCAIKSDEEKLDEVHCEEEVIEELDLNASIQSTYSLKEANLTLKPGSMTYPLVTPRDKRRMKGEDSLNASLNLNSSLNNSENMAQLSRTMQNLPVLLDRKRLPKIPGMEQISIKNYKEKNVEKIKEGDLLNLKNIHNEKKNEKTNIIDKKKCENLVKNQLPLDRRKSKRHSDDEESISRDIYKPDKDETMPSEESESDTDTIENKLSPNLSTSKFKKKNITRSKRIDNSRSTSESSTSNEDGKRRIKDSETFQKDSLNSILEIPEKCKENIKDVDINSLEDGSDDEDSEESEIEIDEVDASKSKKMKVEMKKIRGGDKNKYSHENDITKNLQSKSARIANVSNHLEEEEEEESSEEDNMTEDESEDDEEDVNSKKSKKENQNKSEVGQKNKGLNKNKRKTKKKENREDINYKKYENRVNHIEVEDEDQEEDTEEEDSDIGTKKKQKVSKKTEKKVKKTEKRSKKRRSEEKIDSGDDDGEKEDPGDDDDEDEEDEVNTKKVKKLKGKKKNKKVKVEDEHQDDNEEEEAEEEEEEEEEEEDDEEGKVGDGKEVSKSKESKMNKLKADKSKDEEKEISEKTTKAEEPNRSGFLNFFRRNKKPKVDVAPDTKVADEKTDDKASSTGNNQSRTCTVL